MLRPNLILPSVAALLCASIAANDANAQAAQQDASPPTNAQRTVDPLTSQLDRFEDLDRNRDDYVSKDEIPITHVLSEAFGSLDGNQDNRLERSEFAKYNPAARQPY